MSPQLRKTCINITIHHHFLVCIENKTLLLGTLEILTYPLHINFMWCLSVMNDICTLMNRKLYIWYCVWYQIKHHTYDRFIWIGTIYLSLRIIIIHPKRRLNNGGFWKLITIINPCVFQEFKNKLSLIKLKYTIIQCIDFNT